MSDIDRTELYGWVQERIHHDQNDLTRPVWERLARELREGRFAVDKDEDTIPIAALPPGCIQTGSFALRSYIDPDGQASYMISTRGEMQGTTLIGQLERAKLDIYQVLDAPNWGGEE